MKRFNYILMSEESGGEATGGTGSTEATATTTSEATQATDTTTQEAVSTAQTTEPTTTQADKQEEMILGKFKDVDALTDAYSNLQKKMGSFQGAPKDGYAAIEGLENTTPEQNRLMAVLQEVGKDAQMGQETYEKLFTDITEMQSRVQAEQLEATVKEIPNYDTRAKAMQDTALRFLRPDQIQGIDSLMQSKESFEAFEILMGQMRGGAIPANPGTTATSQEELRKQIRELNPADSAGRARLLNELNQAGDGEGRLV